MLIKRLKIQDGLFLTATFVLPLAWLMSLSKITQNPIYHNFADQSTILGIPHFYDVVTNIFFLVVGVMGIREHLRSPFSLSKLILVIGVLLVAPGSTYYHLLPNNERLLWDRLPMVLGFCSLTTWLLIEYFQIKKEKLLLALLNLVGLVSLAVWVSTEDLRFYYWVQLSPVVLLLYLAVFKRSMFQNANLVFGAFAFYVLAKLTETYDEAIFVVIGLSGHSIKHILAAIAVYFLIKLEINKSLTNSNTTFKS
ncbi:MAG: hypothetical protein CME67_00755 [Halobacteriovoraceae bacterium]|nr:hypothetical protein [Halobacteriovoraceae bacterium]|tara:strand:+ start:2560 stop:3315 length:756 start_codon:yes stop_codon:yes gene_type:complete